MGARNVFTSIPACSESELRIKFREHQDDESYDNGHAAYSAHMGQARGLDISSRTFKSEDEADSWLQDKTQKYGPALAVKVGEFKPCFPATAKDKKLNDTLTELNKELSNFELDIVARAKAQKSSKRACTHCGSSISVKHLEVPKVKGIVGRMTEIPEMVGFMGDFYVTSVRKVTDCPVCGKNLLITETDQKRKAVLVSKQKEFNQKVLDAKKAHDAKLKGKQGFWLVGATVAE